MVEEMFSDALIDSTGRRPEPGPPSADDALNYDQFKKFSTFLMQACQMDEELFDGNEDKDVKLAWSQISVRSIFDMVGHKWVVHPNMTEDDFYDLVKEMFQVADKDKDSHLTYEEFLVFGKFVLEAC